MKYATTIGERTYIIEINRDGEITLDGERFPIDLQAIDDVTYSLLIGNASHEALVEANGEDLVVLLHGRRYNARVMDERARRLAESSGGLAVSTGEITIKSPMPGLIVAVPVDEGQAVTKGQTLIVLESMKMENELKVPVAGRVTAIRAAAGQPVDKGAPLVEVVCEG